MSYENWVDNLIKTHKQRLDDLRINRDTEFDYSSSGRVKYNNKRNFQNSPLSETYSYSVNDENEYKLLKQRRIEKMMQSLVEENAQLRFCLSEKETILAELKDNLSYNDNQNKSNSNLFFEREKDLLETLKMVNYENKKLEEKVAELKLQLSKTKGLDIMAEERNENEKKDNFKNFNTTINGSVSSKFKRSTEDETQLLVLKLEKIIDIFLQFFKNYGLTDLSQIAKTFDYEGLRKKLADFQNTKKCWEEPNNKANLDNDKNILNNSKIENFANNNLQDRSRNITPTNKIDSNNNTNTQSTQQMKINQTHNISIAESEIFLKLDQRLKDLETNVNSLIKERSVSSDRRLANTNRNRTNINSISKTTKSKNLTNQIKNTKINMSKLGSSFANANNVTNTTANPHSSRIHTARTDKK